MTIDQMSRQNDAKLSAATAASAAAHDFARAANGNNGHVTPGPVAYDLLGNIKTLLWYIREVTEHLPHGLTASLNDPRISVHDQVFATGEVRDPAAQVAIATENLNQLNAALRAAADHAETAQTAIANQGYDERTP